MRERGKESMCVSGRERERERETERERERERQRAWLDENIKLCTYVVLTFR